jgi:hypothetical protein
MSMRRICLAMTLIFAIPHLASAQLRFPQPMVNLGELRGGPIYPHTFDFVNDGNQPLEITDIRFGCGCLNGTLDKRIIQPGQKGSLVMTVRTLGQPGGPRTWQAQVHYRIGTKLAEVPVIIGANIHNEVTIEPSIIGMTIDTTLRQEVTIKDTRATPMKIAAIRASSPAIRVKVLPTENGVTKVLLEVSRSDLTAVRQEAMLNIYGDDPNYRQLQVPITLIKANRAEVTASPDKVEITSGSQLVRFRASGDKTVRIEKAEADDPAIRCTWAPGPGDDATLKITADPAKAASGNARVTIHFRTPADHSMVIPVLLRK